jgi:hypothetical protein
MEYNHLLDMLCTDASFHKDPMLRLAIVGIYTVTQLTSCDRGFNKPFNPLLGETYELITDDFQFLAEQVSHHPPVTAWYCKGTR